MADTRGNQALSEDHEDHKGADHPDEGAWFSWLERLPVTQEAADSSLVAPASAHASLDCSTFRGTRGTAEQLRCSMTNKRPTSRLAKTGSQKPALHTTPGDILKSSGVEEAQ